MVIEVAGHVGSDFCFGREDCCGQGVEAGVDKGTE